jgi:hypothetical protein
VCTWLHADAAPSAPPHGFSETEHAGKRSLTYEPSHDHRPLQHRQVAMLTDQIGKALQVCERRSGAPRTRAARQ